MTNHIELDLVVQLDPELIYSKVGDEIVLLNMETGDYFKVNSVGSRIWDLINNPMKVSEICSVLLSEYEITAEVCEKEVLSFISLLKEKSFLAK